MQTAKKLLTWDTRLNIRALADEGFELAECKGNYFLKYGKEFIDLGNLKLTAKQFTSLFDKKNSTKAKKALEEWIERIRLRREALAEFSEKLGKEVVDNLKSHINGEVSLKIKGKNSKGQPIYEGKGIGIHNYFQVIAGKVRLRVGKETIPPNPALDEPFLAYVQIYDDLTKQWYNKGNSSFKIAGKGDKSLTTMFPKNWNEQRIMEEVAFAWKNMKFVEKFYAVQGSKNVLVEKYIGKSTTGFDIELIFNDGILISTPPKVNF